jgi:hypothetical protein
LHVFQRLCKSIRAPPHEDPKRLRRFLQSLNKQRGTLGYGLIEGFFAVGLVK